VLLDENCEGRIQTILYVVPNTTASSDDVLMSIARRLGWTVLSATRVNEIGLPFLKEMFLETERLFPNCTFYGFANGDILFNTEVMQTLQAVSTVCRKLIFSCLNIVNMVLITWHNSSVLCRLEQN